MSPRQPSNYDLVEDLIANIAHAGWVASMIGDWTGLLRSAATDTSRVTNKGEHSDPAGNAATREFDRNQQLVTSAQMQLDDLERLRVIANRMNLRRHGTLVRPTLKQAKASIAERTTPVTVGWCIACDKHCDASTEAKKLKNRLCDACRQAELRAWQASGLDATDRQRHRDEWIRTEHEQHVERSEQPTAS